MRRSISGAGHRVSSQQLKHFARPLSNDLVFLIVEQHSSRESRYRVAAWPLACTPDELTWILRRVRTYSLRIRMPLPVPSEGTVLIVPLLPCQRLDAAAPGPDQLTDIQIDDHERQLLATRDSTRLIWVELLVNSTDRTGKRVVVVAADGRL